MTSMLSLPTELMLLGWSVVLFFVHIMLQAQTMTKDAGAEWNMGARDGVPPVIGALAGRATRALSNFKESYPIFVALALGLAVSGRVGGIGAIGAWIWFVARIVYIPLYLRGVPYVRTACWMVSMVGAAADADPVSLRRRP